jgi:hypothetical protein
LSLQHWPGGVLPAARCAQPRRPSAAARCGHLGCVHCLKKRASFPGQPGATLSRPEIDTVGTVRIRHTMPLALAATTCVSASEQRGRHWTDGFQTQAASSRTNTWATLELCTTAHCATGVAATRRFRIMARPSTQQKRARFGVNTACCCAFASVDCWPTVAASAVVNRIAQWVPHGPTAALFEKVREFCERAKRAPIPAGGRRRKHGICIRRKPAPSCRSA